MGVQMGVSQIPTIICTVYSESYFGKINVEGYGFAHLPSGAGSIDMEIKTWKPVEGITAEMKNYFLGSGPRLKDNKFIFGGTSNSQTTINRFGVRTENAGLVRFRCHASCTDPRKVIEEDKEDLVATGKVAAVRRTVDDILKEYRAGASVAKSIEAASLRRGSVLDASRESRSSAVLRSSSNGSLLAKKAEMLIAQAKARLTGSSNSISVSGKQDVGAAARSVLGSALSQSAGSLGSTTGSILEAKEEDADDATPLLGTRELTSSLGLRAGAPLGGTRGLAPLNVGGEAKAGPRSAVATRYDSGDESDDSAKGLISKVDGEED